MNPCFAVKIPSFRAAKLRVGWLLRAVCGLNLKIVEHHLRRPELIRGSLAVLQFHFSALLQAGIWQLNPTYSVVESILGRES